MVRRHKAKTFSVADVIFEAFTSLIHTRPVNAMDVFTRQSRRNQCLLCSTILKRVCMLKNRGSGSSSFCLTHIACLLLVLASLSMHHYLSSALVVAWQAKKEGGRELNLLLLHCDGGRKDGWCCLHCLGAKGGQSAENSQPDTFNDTMIRGRKKEGEIGIETNAFVIVNTRYRTPRHFVTYGRYGVY